MALIKILIHAVMVFLLTNAIALCPWTKDAPALVFLLNIVGYAGFLPFSLTTAAVLNQHKPAVIGIMSLTILLGSPSSIVALSHQVMPVGAGIIIGSLTRSLITNNTGRDT